MSMAELRELETEIDFIDSTLDILDPDNAIESQWIEIYANQLDSIILQIEQSMRGAK